MKFVLHAFLLLVCHARRIREQPEDWVMMKPDISQRRNDTSALNALLLATAIASPMHSHWRNPRIVNARMITDFIPTDDGLDDLDSADDGLSIRPSTRRSSPDRPAPGSVQDSMQASGSRDPYERRDSMQASGARDPYERRDPMQAPGARDPYERRNPMQASGARDPYERRDPMQASGARDPYERRDPMQASGARDPYERRDSMQASGARDPYARRDSMQASGTRGRDDRRERPSGERGTQTQTLEGSNSQIQNGRQGYTSSRQTGDMSNRRMQESRTQDTRQGYTRSRQTQEGDNRQPRDSQTSGRQGREGYEMQDRQTREVAARGYKGLQSREQQYEPLGSFRKPHWAHDNKPRPPYLDSRSGYSRSSMRGRGAYSTESTQLTDDQQLWGSGAFRGDVDSNNAMNNKRQGQSARWDDDRRPLDAQRRPGDSDRDLPPGRGNRGSGDAYTNGRVSRDRPRHDDRASMDSFADGRAPRDRRRDDRGPMDSYADGRAPRDRPLRRDDRGPMDSYADGRGPRDRSQGREIRGPMDPYADDRGRRDRPRGREDRGPMDPYADTRRPMRDPRGQNDFYMDGDRPRNFNTMSDRRGPMDPYADRSIPRDFDAGPQDVYAARGRPPYRDGNRQWEFDNMNDRRGPNNFYPEGPQDFGAMPVRPGDFYEDGMGYNQQAPGYRGYEQSRYSDDIYERPVGPYESGPWDPVRFSDRMEYARPPQAYRAMYDEPLRDASVPGSSYIESAPLLSGPSY